jgi:hypothetical protein
MSRIICTLLLLSYLGSRGVDARVSDAEAERRALEAVRALAGHATQATPERVSGAGRTFKIDGRWTVTVEWVSGGVFRMSDREAEAGRANRVPLPDGLEDAEIIAEARQLVLKVHPRFDEFEHSLLSVSRLPRYSWVDVTWQQVIPENGFPTGAVCSVSFGWQDRCVRTLAAFDLPIPSGWTRQPSVTAEEACALADGAVELPSGCAADYQAKKWCEVGAPDFAANRPVWKVVAFEKGTQGPGYGDTYGVVYVDPWTGEVFGAHRVMGAGGPPQDGDTVRDHAFRDPPTEAAAYGGTSQQAGGDRGRLALVVAVPLALAVVGGVSLFVRRCRRPRGSCP